MAHSVKDRVESAAEAAERELGFTESLRAELEHEGSGVCVTTVDLPALNTPQLGWVRARLPNHPKPVPPIFQPEVAARAILWAIEHRPRELFAGGSTVVTRFADVVAPGLVDRYLARTAFDDQQTDEPIGPDRRDNLDGPVDDRRDHGARGAFDDVAKSRSVHVWATTHKTVVAATTGMLALAAGATKRTLRNR